MKNWFYQQGYHLAVLLFLSFYTVPALSFRQTPADTYFHPEVIPPAPNVASLAKFIETPVGTATGLPEINIPIYTMSAGELSIPISISYHAAGCKVDEISSWIGSGWALNAGGMVSKSIRGRPDGSGGVSYFSSGMDILYNGNNLKDLSVINCNDIPFLTMEQIAQGCYDTQPDLYYFSAGAVSGKFLYRRDQSLFMMPVQPITVTADDLPFGNMQQWTIVGEDGTVYLFGKGNKQTTTVRDYTTHTRDASVSACGYVTSGYNAWHLVEMISPSRRDTIFFSYRSETTRSTSLSAIRYVGNPQKVGNEGGSETVINAKVLSSIYSSNGDSVVFIADASERLDYEGSHRLKEIEIYVQHKRIKSFVLTHAYVTANEQDINDSYVNKSLSLTQIQEFSADKLRSIPPYLFTYNSTGYFPNRYSSKHDYWGFFNNSSTGSLEPNETHLKAAVLKKIQFPTGGSREFEMEIATFSNLLNMDYVELPANLGIDPIVTFRQNNTASQKNFSIAATTFGTITWERPLCPTGSSNCYLRIVKVGTGIIWTANYNETEAEITLPPGDYTIEGMFSVAAHEYDPFVHFIRLDLGGLHEQGDPIWNQPGGGLRVKTITNYSKPGYIASKFAFEYWQEPNRSSGLLSESLKVSYDQFFETGCSTLSTSAVPTGGTLYKVVNRKNWPNPVKGSYVTYGTVTVYEGTNFTTDYSQANGKTVYTFTNPGLQINTFGHVNFPPVPTYRPEYKFSLPLEVKKYNYDPATAQFSLVSKMTNTYSYSNESTLNSLVVGYRYNYACPSNGTLQCLPYFYVGYQDFYGKDAYTEYSGRSILTSTIDSLYTAQGAFVNKSTYYYDNPQHSQLTRTFFLKSLPDGTISGRATVVKYPLDVSGNNTGNTFMKKHHILNAVAEEIHLNGIDTVYKARITRDVGADSLLIKRSVEVAPQGTAYQPKEYYELYSSKGNILQRRSDTGVLRSYIWGYDQQLPIAEVIGAAANQIFHTSFEDSGESGIADTTAVTGRKVYSGQFIVPVPSAGNYVLTYWTKEPHSPWILHTEYFQTVSATTRTINSPLIKLDEVRLYPVEAQMTTLTHDPGTGVTSMNDVNNIVTYYLYDKFNRVIALKDHNGNLLKTFQYNYANSGN